jgi:hypothetical protein
MPTPINVNRPLNLDYKNGKADAAAYRHSLSLKDAANKIKQSSRGAALKLAGVRFTSLLKEIIIEKKRFRSKFNTNPWVGNASASGKEYTVETEKWRLVSFSTAGKPLEWFLAYHVGANNAFEFWHISNTSSLKGAAKPPQQPRAVQPTQYEVVDDQWGNTMEIVQPADKGSGAASWEDII